MDNTITFELFKEQWLEEIVEGNPNTVQLGNRFSRKLISQWLDFDEGTEDVIYCDGSGDGGIDIAYLHRGETEDGGVEGDTWFLVQSKYGKAFGGVGTILSEGQKVIDTISGHRTNLSSLTQDLIERINNFREVASEKDRIVLVYAIERQLNEDEKRSMADVRSIGKERLGSLFEVESVSIETIYNRTLEEGKNVHKLEVPLKAKLVPSGDELLVGSTKLIDLYEFLKSYKNKTNDLDLLFEKNVRKFLGNRRKVNKGIEKTLNENPDRFGLYNNGITIVVENFNFKNENEEYNLIEPFIVNGCQTTKTIWSVLTKKLDSGGTGTNPEFEKWYKKLEKGIVVLKIVKVGFQGETLLNDTTRYTNSQNAVSEKDFIALETNFQSWARAMSSKYGVYLEIQRGGWDSRMALQKQNPSIQPFYKEYANTFDLLKVYAAGWLCEPGLAFGKNPPFAPGGSIFNKITEDKEFGLEDLYAAYLLSKEAKRYNFGRGSIKPTRGQTRFLFFMITIDILKDVMLTAFNDPNKVNKSNITKAILELCKSENSNALSELLETAIQVVDEYLTNGAEDSLFSEPTYKNDLNAFLKWEQLGKSESSTPRLKSLLAIHKRTMKRNIGGKIPYNLVLESIKKLDSDLE